MKEGTRQRDIDERLVRDFLALIEVFFGNLNKEV